MRYAYHDRTAACDIYHKTIDLSREEKDAIETLTSLHPDDLFEPSDDDQDVEMEPEVDQLEQARAVFPVNTVLYFRKAPFTETSLSAFAELMSFGEYIMDAIHLAAHVERPSMPALIWASIAATINTDARGMPNIDAHKKLEDDMDVVLDDAQGLFNRCLSLRGRG